MFTEAIIPSKEEAEEDADAARRRAYILWSNKDEEEDKPVNIDATKSNAFIEEAIRRTESLQRKVLGSKTNKHLEGTKVLNTNSRFRTKQSKDREFIIDSGATYHMMDSNELTPEEKRTIKPLISPIPLQAAGGIIVVDECADVYCAEINRILNMVLHEGAPPVLSMGKLCAEENCDFNWCRNRMPTITVHTKEGPFVIELELVNDCPTCCPATPPNEEEQEEEDPNWEHLKSEGVVEIDSDKPDDSKESGHTGDSEESKSVRDKKEKRKPKKKRKKPKLEGEDDFQCYPCGPLKGHNFITHTPKHGKCPICNGSKTQNRQSRRRRKRGYKKTEGEAMPEATKFAHSITLDPFIFKKQEDASRKGDKVACVIYDIFCKWLQSYAAETNSAETTKKAMRRYLGPQIEPSYIYSDNSKEIAKAVQELQWDDRHDTSLPNRPSTNGTIERCVKTTKEGINATLIQSGASPEWWADAMRFLLNVQRPQPVSKRNDSI